MIGQKSGEGPAARSERSDSVFPEPYGARQDVVPSVQSWKSSDPGAEAAYIGSSDSLPGHEDGNGFRMDDIFSTPYEYSAEPKGSAPQSGEGLNSASKPEGADILPDDHSDFFA